MVQLTTAITIIYSPAFVFKNYGKNVDEIPHYCVNILNFLRKKREKSGSSQVSKNSFILLFCRLKDGGRNCMRGWRGILRMVCVG